MTVHILTIEWRNWSRDVYAFNTWAAAKKHAILVTETETIEEALDSEQNGGHAVYIDTVEVVGISQQVLDDHEQARIARGEL